MRRLLKKKDIAKISLNFLSQHKFILVIIISLYVASFILSLFVGSRTAFLVGEYNFSFDYGGHLSSIFKDLRHKEILFSSTECVGCPSFWSYSRWYSLIKFLIVGGSNILNINSFSYYLFLNISLQLVSLYVFTRLVFKKFSIFAYIISSIIFIAMPYKFSLLGSGSIYAFHHSFLIVLLSLIIYFYKKIHILNIRRIIYISVFTGIVGQFFFNISIGYLPIVIYSVLVLSIYFSKNVIRNLKKVVLMVTIAASIIFITNFPMIISILKGGEKHVYTNYVSFDFIDAFSAGLSSHFEISNIAVLIFFIFTLFLTISSKIEIKNKILLLTLYFMVGVMLMGKNSPINVYNFIFNNLPLMDGIRSNHRFFIFELIILYIFIYSGLYVHLSRKRKKSILLATFISIVMVIIPLQVNIRNLDYIHSVEVPGEYFQADEYLSGLNGKKLYMPFYMPTHQSMSGNYTWYDDEVVHPTIYTNPFISIFSVPGMLSIEGYSFDTIFENELRSQVDISHTKEDIQKYLKSKNVKYLVLDKNFLWKKNFPGLDVESFTTDLTLDKKIGKIYIYRLESASSECKLSYGDFMPGFCTVIEEEPQYLINRSIEEYFLDEYERSNGENKLEIQNTENTYNFIFHPGLQAILNQERTIIPFPVHHTDSQAKDIYKRTVPEGKYKLFFPVLQVRSNNFFKDSKLIIYLNSEKIGEISPEGTKHSFVWKTFGIDNTKEEAQLSIDKIGKGSIIYSDPILFTFEEYERLINTANYKKFNPLIIDKTKNLP